MCYFHDKLCSLSSANIVWYLEDTLNILVTMVAGLWVYATTIVKFIMDQGLSPQQLDHVLEFHL